MAKKRIVNDTEEDLIVSEKDLNHEPEVSSGLEDDKLEEVNIYPGSVTIEYESQGRFSIPETLHWKNWKYEHIHNISLSRPEDRLEAIVKALGDMCPDGNIEIQNMTPEELLETLVGIKAKFQSRTHTHRWMCKCQEDVDEGAQQASEANIDLLQLNYVSIDKAEENLRAKVKEQLQKLAEPQLREYFKKQSKDGTLPWETITIDDFVSRITIKEPFRIQSPVKSYEFRWGRVKDLIAAKRIATREFDFRLKEVKRRRWNNRGSLEDFKNKQEQDIREINEAKGKAIILYARALSLMKVDGKELDESERIREYKAIDPVTLHRYIEYLEVTRFGIQDERDYTCNLCGRTDRGYLQQRADLLEFLPLDANAGRDSTESLTTFVYFGL